MARGPYLATPALSDSDLLKLASWNRCPTESATLKQAASRRAMLMRALFGDTGARDPLAQILCRLGLKLVPDHERGWRVLCSDAPDGSGIALDGRQLELLRLGLAFDASWHRELLQACVETRGVAQCPPDALFGLLHHSEVLAVPGGGDALTR